jgi:hypothetical protein
MVCLKKEQAWFITNYEKKDEQGKMTLSESSNRQNLVEPSDY